MPSRVPMKISLLPSVSCTAISASSSSMPMAMMPPARGLLNAVSSVFLTVPLRVHDHDEALGRLELAHRQQCGDLLVGLHRDQVDDRLALAGRARRPGISCTLSQ